MKSILDDQLILHLYHDEKITAEKIAERFNVSKRTILNHIHNYDKNKQPIQKEVSERKSNKKKNIPLEDIIEFHNLGMRDYEIAEFFGCTRSNITTRLNKAGIKGRKSKIDDIVLRNKISDSLKGKMVGKNNPNYSGYKDEKTIARGLFKTISKEVIRNRDYTCEICGRHGGNLEVHHLKPFKIILKEFLDCAYSNNIENFVQELYNWKDFWDKENLILTCEKCHKQIHYTDNPELSPYRWKSATTIESIDDKTIVEEASRVDSSESKCKGA